MIRRLGSHVGKRIFFGYDRYIVPMLPLFRDVLALHGTVIDAVDDFELHYLSSAELVCTAVQADPDSFGVLCCGTGMGMSIAANKFRDVYAARCMSVDDAEMARTINNANVLCLAAKSELSLNAAIIAAFASTEYSGRKLEELERIRRFEGTTMTSSPPSRYRQVVPLRAVRRTA